MKEITICGHCHRRIFRARDDRWYHRHSASISCRPGWSSNHAYPLTFVPRGADRK